MTHHQHIDFDDQGHTVVTCQKCNQRAHADEDGTVRLLADPCPNDNIAVLCHAEETGIVIDVGDEDV